MSHRYAQTNLQLYQQLRDLEVAPADLAVTHAAYIEATKLLSGVYRPTGKPFVDHLVGTASILAAHGAGTKITLAGLLHAAYRRGDFGTGRPGPTRHKRTRVRAIVGEEAEVLIHAYHGLPWNRQTIDTLVTSQLTPQQSILAFMRLANELEDHLDLGTLYGANAKHRQRYAANWGHVAVKLGGHIGQPALAAELQEAYEATTKADLEQFAALRSSRSDFLYFPPASLRRPVPAIVSRYYRARTAGVDQIKRAGHKARSVLGWGRRA